MCPLTGMLDVVIASPGINFNNYYIWSLVETIEYLNNKNISYRWVNDYSSHVGQARQRIVDNLPPHVARRLFWIDSDIEWTPEQFIKLLNSRHEIVSGVYLTTNNVIAAQKFNNESLRPDEIIHNNIRVKSAGMGFMCMDYDLMLDIQNPFLPVDNIINEDMAMCVRSNAEVYLDTSVKLIHHKTVPLVL